VSSGFASSSGQTGAEALDTVAVDLPEGTLVAIAAELDGLARRLDVDSLLANSTRYAMNR
jgi:hypothetical protein